MRTPRLLPIIAVALVGLCLLGRPASADLEGQMQDMFDGLVNISDPGAFDSQARGVISGGSVYARSRIMNADLVAFAPPRLEAGCGGIDFFAGSFSFINAEEFQALLRAIAANAAGYAFQLALGAMCESCLNTIETLQKKIQELNQHFGNSCQLAQGLVNDTLGAMMGKTVGDASLIATAEGAAEDLFSGWTVSGGQTQVQKAVASGSDQVDERVFGNIIWRALKRQGAQDWFAAGDNDFLQVIMNVSGTVIVSPPASGGDTPLDPVTVYPVTSLLNAVIEGERVTIRGCADGFDSNECLELTNVDIDLTNRGLRKQIEQALIGSSSSPGIIAKFRDPSKGTPTPHERRVLAMMAGASGAMIVRLSHYSEEAAREFAREAAYYVAIQMADVLVRSAREAAEAALAGADDGFVPLVHTVLGASREGLNAEVARLTELHGSLADLIGLYERYMSVMPTPGFAPRGSPAAR